MLQPSSPDLSGSRQEEAFYLEAAGERTFVVLHRARTPSGIAVILCPPFGFEEVCSYRPRRAWAQSLASEGHSTLRLSFPSTGDSGGSAGDPGRLAAWTDSVASAAAWMRSQPGTRRVVVIGMELGAMMAYRAAAQGAEIDDLVLWSAKAAGRALIRQLTAFARMERGSFFVGLPEPPPGAEGELEAGGFLLAAETVSDLKALDLSAIELPPRGRRRVLVLDRDGVATDAALLRALERAGVDLTVAPGTGYELMTSHPQLAQPAAEVFATVSRWLGEIAASDEPPTPHDAAAVPTMQAQLAGEGGWTESPVTIPALTATLAGVLTTPNEPASDGLCAVLLNAGAVRRIGANRMWVEVARRWAEHGVPSLRLDMEGIGDAAGPTVGYPDDVLFHQPKLTAQVRSALDFLQARGAGEHFLLLGMCSGAYWSYRMALEDPRVSGVAMLNQRVVQWDAALAPSRYFRTLIRTRPSLAEIRGVATLPLVLSVVRWLIGAPLRGLRRLLPAGQAGRGADEIERGLARLRDSGTRVTYVFSYREPLYDELAESGWLARLLDTGRVTLERVEVTDHTLRPTVAQRAAHAALDRALERELALVSDRVRPAAQSV